MTFQTLILDTETTGLKNPEPCQIAYIAMQDLEFHLEKPLYAARPPEVQTFNQLFRTTKPIEKEAAKIHGITNESISDRPHWNVFSIPDSTRYIIGHNISFDLRVLQITEGYKFICTLKLARLLWPELSSYKLFNILTEKFPGIIEKLKEDAHDALIDVKGCLLILQSALDEFEGISTWDHFHELAGISIQEQKLPEIMPFGKYKGWKFSEIKKLDPSYFTWLLKQDINSSLRKAIEAITG